MSERRPRGGDQGGASLRDWLEYVIETAIDMLDALDAAAEDLEDDEEGEVLL